MPRTKDKQVRKNLRLPIELVEWVESFARTKHTNFTQVIIRSIVELQERNGA